MLVLHNKVDLMYPFRKYEGLWRLDKVINTKIKYKYDYNNKIYPYPIPHDTKWNKQDAFYSKFLKVNKLATLEIFTQRIKYKIKKGLIYPNCLLCGEQNIYNDIRGLINTNIHWTDTLFHYISVHNVKPSDEFINFILNYKYKNRIIYDTLPSQTFILPMRQLHILDLLLKSNIIPKVETYNNSKIKGLIDFTLDGIKSISIDSNLGELTYVSGKGLNIARKYDIQNYEVMFYIHPLFNIKTHILQNHLISLPTLLQYNIFIVHFMDKITQGMLINTMEGMYYIYCTDPKLEYIMYFTSRDLRIKLEKLIQLINTKLIKKYGLNIDDNIFYSKIAQETKHITEINKILNQKQIHLKYYPRVFKKGKWIHQKIELDIQVKIPRLEK